MIKVIPQLTISRSRISLVAEENVTPFSKGAVVKTVTPEILASMARPLKCAISKNGFPRPILR